MKFYQTTWFIILMLFAFAPVGIFLMWKFKPNWGKTAKYVLSVAFGFCFLMCCIVAFIPTEETQPTSALPSVSVTNSQTTEPTNRSDHKTHNRNNNATRNYHKTDNRNYQKVQPKFFQQQKSAGNYKKAKCDTRPGGKNHRLHHKNRR